MLYGECVAWIQSFAFKALNLNGTPIIGYTLAQRFLLTVYVERVERIRIISARLATRAERLLYEES